MHANVSRLPNHHSGGNVEAEHRARCDRQCARMDRRGQSPLTTDVDDGTGDTRRTKARVQVLTFGSFGLVSGLAAKSSADMVLESCDRGRVFTPPPPSSASATIRFCIKKLAAQCEIVCKACGGFTVNAKDQSHRVSTTD
jgi:hypothetical protein